MKKTSILAVFLMVLLSFSATVSAASLWSDSGPGALMFGDRKAHAVGDIVTIIINETSSASRSGNASNSKSASTSTEAGTGIFHGIAEASATNQDAFSAKGSLSNTNKVTGQMTAQVTAVKPNGNLVISGSQSIKQNNETQKITVTGEVRPEDITANNTVLSSYIANAEIKIDGNGPISSKQRQGIITQIWNFLF